MAFFENWDLVTALVSVLIIIILAVVAFFALPSKSRLNIIKSWLLIIVIKAEKELGSKTGKAKLAYAYDLFIDKFKVLSLFISYEKFEALVDEALKEMNNILSDQDSDLKEILDDETKKLDL